MNCPHIFGLQARRLKYCKSLFKRDQNDMPVEQASRLFPFPQGQEPLRDE